MGIFSKQKSYLDYASGAPILKEAAFTMNELNKLNLANPASIHTPGVLAKKYLEDARNNLSKFLNVHNDEIIFTGSGTESIALALIGTVHEAKKTISNPHVVTSTIEHSSVLETCKMLQSRGTCEVTFLEPDDEFGLINPESIKKSIKENTVLVTLALVNSELGTVQPFNEYIKVLNKFKEEKYNIESMRFTAKAYYPYLHMDACQANAHIKISDYARKGIDMISLNSIKIGGPSGIALLYKKRSINLERVYAGGEQEMGLRPGTASPVLANAFAKAMEINLKEMDKNEEQYKNLKEFFINELDSVKKEFKFEFIENSSDKSIPSIVNISFPYFKGDHMAIELDARGVYVSSKSACKSEDSEESYVIKEIRKKLKNNPYKSYGNIRVSFGPENTVKDVTNLINQIKQILRTYSAMI